MPSSLRGARALPMLRCACTSPTTGYLIHITSNAASAGKAFNKSPVPRGTSTGTAAPLGYLLQERLESVAQRCHGQSRELCQSLAGIPLPCTIDQPVSQLLHTKDE